jgi:hypothetical protein
VNRQNSHIKLVARKLLTSQKEKVDEARINTIIETLTEKMYSHGYAIGRAEAKDIGLKVQYPDPTTEDLLWRLYLSYEDDLQLNDTIDPDLQLGTQEESEMGDLEIAIIESVNKLHVFKINVRLKKDRQIPQSPNININMNLQFPANIQPQQLPAQIQQIIQQMMAQLVNPSLSLPKSAPTGISARV